MTRIIPVTPPAAELNAIRLSGRLVNPNPEAWESMPDGLPPGAEGGGVANFGEPELWVRNVSQPTLAPFLPTAQKRSGSAMLVIPGGAFMGLAIDREGYSVARWLNQLGVAAFVLKYRVSPLPADPQEALAELNRRVAQAAARVIAADPDAGKLSDASGAALNNAREDGLEAVRYIRSHAAEWGVLPNRVGVIGFSAGAVAALDIALKADAQSRPDYLAPIYGMLPGTAPVPRTAPPAFIAVAADDLLAANGLAIYNAWRASSVPAELHVFESGGHGFGAIRQGKTSDQWMELFDRWLTVRWTGASTP